MSCYNTKLTDIFTQYNTSNNGLTSKEAKRRQEKYGKNEIETEKKRPCLENISQPV